MTVLFRARFFLFELVFFLVLSINSSVPALDVPPLRARVNDLAKILTAEKTKQLEQQLREFEQQTSHQITILTIPSLEGDPIEDFGIRVAEAWKIGQKGTANGVILIVAQKERKIRIEVGRGFEGILPDVIASRIIREVIAPRYREGDYAGSIQAGIDSILEVTRGEAVPKTSRTLPRTTGNRPVTALFFFVILFALIVGISQRTPLRGALGGAISASVVGIPGAVSSGPGLWVAILLAGGIVGAFANFCAAAVLGTPRTVRGSRRESCPRDT